MNKNQLVQLIKAKQSFLCVGLDPDISLFPNHLKSNLLENYIAFNRAIIDATRDHCVAYKLNTAFYECLGIDGWELFQDSINYIGKEHFIISDAKRGDIGNTSKMYAKTFFETYETDAITVAPYMGEDSITPFYAYPNKWVIILALTSNSGSKDFQLIQNKEEKPLFESVLEKTSQWGNAENTMYVVGATHPSMFNEIRKIVPNHFLLVPGVGTQGGNLEELCKYGLNKDIGLLVNVSRQISYASQDTDFQEAAKAQATIYHEKMKILLQ